MDIQAYIASGVLEQYVLGDLSAAERAEVEQYARQYPAIRSEIEAIEAALETSARLNAIAAPAALEQQILEKIDAREKTQAATGPPKRRRVGPAVLLLMLAAALALLVWGLSQNQKARQTEAELDALQVRFDSLAADCAQLESGSEAYQRLINFLLDPDTEPTLINGTDKAPSANAVVYWNPAARQASLQVLELPAPPPDRQYQLWAIVDNGQESMGVFEVEADGRALIDLPFEAEPNAFAVTLEPRGGSPSPTLSEMYLLGERS